MSAMADFFSQLEGYENLEPSIIRATKVHKVLKAIVKLASIPKDDLYAIVRMAHERGIYVWLDECYAYLNFSGDLVSGASPMCSMVDS